MKDKILLIEDDKSIQRFLRISLETKDYKVISAETGIEGISLYMTDNPDLIDLRCICTNIFTWFINSSHHIFQNLCTRTFGL